MGEKEELVIVLILQFSVLQMNIYMRIMHCPVVVNVETR